LLKQTLLLGDNQRVETRDLPLDLANTADWHGSETPVESLHTYTDLLIWAQEHDLLTDDKVAILTQRARAEPAKAEKVLAQAIALREAIYAIFSATAKDQNPAVGDMAVLNVVLARAFKQLRVTQVGDDFMLIMGNTRDALEQMLWPVAYATMALLTSDDLSRVKECEDKRGCGFLFFDTSKNRSRRWCAMDSCGNRAKVRRHRRRIAASGQG
jgi:predicted RNA-binding Zn ribbon-like protein